MTVGFDYPHDIDRMRNTSNWLVACGGDEHLATAHLLWKAANEIDRLMGEIDRRDHALDPLGDALNSGDGSYKP